MRMMCAAMVLMTVLVVNAETKYVIIVDATGTNEVSSYVTSASTNEIWAKAATQNCAPVLVAKAEYDVDAAAKPEDRLTSISTNLIAAAVAQIPDKQTQKESDETAGDWMKGYLAAKKKTAPAEPTIEQVEKETDKIKKEKP